MSNLTELEDYYKNLLIIQYHDKAKAQAVISNWVDCMVADGLFLDLPEAFNVDTAIGAQLDLIGKIVGLPRYGFDDDQYRILLNLRIITNNTGVSMKDIDDIMYNYALTVEVDVDDSWTEENITATQNGEAVEFFVENGYVYGNAVPDGGHVTISYNG